MILRLVTPTLGESPHLATAAGSIARAAPDAEAVAVGPAARAGEVRARAPGARWVSEAGNGLYAALNQGLRAPPQDWSAFTWLNDDDELLTPGFGALAAELERRPEIDVMFGRVRLIDGRGACVGAHPVARRGEDVRPLLSRGMIPFAQPGTVIRRGIYDRLAGFDESYRLAGDLDFFVRALSGGAAFAFADAWVASFRLSAGQLSKQRGRREEETRRALAPLVGTRAGIGALVRFRMANWRVYADRIRRHGWASMDQVYDRVS